MVVHNSFKRLEPLPFTGLESKNHSVYMVSFERVNTDEHDSFILLA